MKYFLNSLPVDIKDKEERYNLIKDELMNFVKENNKYPLTVHFNQNVEWLSLEESIILNNDNDAEYHSEVMSHYNSFMSHGLAVDYMFQDIGLVDISYERFKTKKYGSEESFKDFIENNPRAYFDLKDDIKEINPIKNNTLRWFDFSNVESFIKIYGIINPSKTHDYELNNFLNELFEKDKKVENYDEENYPGLRFYIEQLKLIHKRYSKSLEKEDSEKYLSLRSLESYMYFGMDTV